MICKTCNIDSQPFRYIFKNGAKAVTDRCPECMKCPNPNRAFLPMREYDWNTLPLYKDDKDNCIPCSYIGCENKGTELHHFAPKQFFQDADNWPMNYLCKYHHDLWHKTINK